MSAKKPSTTVALAVVAAFLLAVAPLAAEKPKPPKVPAKIKLSVDPKSVGRIGGGKRQVTGEIDVAMIQSLVRKDEVADLVAGYGHVVVDECHHIPAASFERVLAEVKARYVTGLTATPRRRGPSLRPGVLGGRAGTRRGHRQSRGPRGRRRRRPPRHPPG